MSSEDSDNRSISNNLVPPIPPRDDARPAREPTSDDFNLKRENYEEGLKKLGEGGNGVVKIWRNTTTEEIVAVKHIVAYKASDPEVNIMKDLMRQRFDQHNIIKYHGWFDDSTSGKQLVYELLSVDLWKYMERNNNQPMDLSDIRDILRQMATALDALRSIGLVHCDIKPNNIMIVDNSTRPFQVKLIDFGLARHKKFVLNRPILTYRAPEIFSGWPYSEAIDMWSLGCVMALLFTGSELFRGGEETVKTSIENLCRPENEHPKTKGDRTEGYLKERLKICAKRLETKGDDEEEQEQFVELLNAMLAYDPDERITPHGVLSHPFIINWVRKDSGSSIYDFSLLTGINETSQSSVEVPECTTKASICEDSSSQTGINKTSQSSVEVPECTTKASICEDSSSQTGINKTSQSSVEVPECTTKVSICEDSSSQTGINKTSQSSVEVPECTTKVSICKVSTTSDTNGTQKGKKRKQFMRFFSRIMEIIKRKQFLRFFSRKGKIVLSALLKLFRMLHLRSDWLSEMMRQLRDIWRRRRSPKGKQKPDCSARLANLPEHLGHGAHSTTVGPEQQTGPGPSAQEAPRPAPPESTVTPPEARGQVTTCPPASGPSHLQETEALKKDLLKNQQEGEENERVMTPQVVELEAQIQKKKKKKTMKTMKTKKKKK